MTEFVAMFDFMAKFGAWLAEKLATKMSGPFIEQFEKELAKKIAEKPPTDTIRVVVNRHGTWWHHCPENAPNSRMQLVADLHVTNITPRLLKLVAARLEDPMVELTVATQALNSSRYGDFAMHSHVSTSVSIHGFAAEKVQAGQPFSGTVVLIDQYANEHRVDVVFRSADAAE